MANRDYKKIERIIKDFSLNVDEGSDSKLEDVCEVSPTTETQTILPTEGFDGFKKVEVEAVDPSEYQKFEETAYVSPTTENQTITPEEGYVYNSIEVEAVNAEIDSNIIADNIKKDVTILGVTGEYEGEPYEDGLWMITDGEGTQITGVTEFNEASLYHYNENGSSSPELFPEITSSGIYSIYVNSDYPSLYTTMLFDYWEPYNGQGMYYFSNSDDQVYANKVNLDTDRAYKYNGDGTFEEFDLYSGCAYEYNGDGTFSPLSVGSLICSDGSSDYIENIEEYRMYYMGSGCYPMLVSNLSSGSIYEYHGENNFERISLDNYSIYYYSFDSSSTTFEKKDLNSGSGYIYQGYGDFERMSTGLYLIAGVSASPSKVDLPETGDSITITVGGKSYTITAN